MPVIEFRALANSLPTDHPMLLGYDPLPHLGEADAILCVDSDVPWIPPRHGDPAPGRKVIQLAADPLFQRLPIRGFPCDVAVTGATAVALPQLAAALAGRIAPAAIAARRQRLAAAREAPRRRGGAGPGARRPQPGRSIRPGRATASRAPSRPMRSSSTNIR